jgi:predicted PurR-regulated permease PerM
VSEEAAWRIVLRGILLTFALVALALVLGQLRSVLVQLALAVLLAAAANPLVDGLTTSPTAMRWRSRPTRGIAALMVFLAGLWLLGLGLVIVLATVGPDLRTLAANSPAYVTQAEGVLEETMRANPDLAARISGALPSLQGALGGAVALLGQASRLLGVATGLVTGLLYLVFALILALYLTIDGDRIRRYLISFLPFDRHEQALHVTERIGLRLGAWARGEALLAVIIGVMTWIAALALGLPYSGALALFAAVGELVPNLGPILAAIPLVVVGFLSSPTQGALALAVAILIQQLENNLIVPRVMARAVNLHPVAVMVAILAGAELLGIPGALMAVPLVASLSVIVEEIQRERLDKHLAAPANAVESSAVRGN